MRFSRLTAEQPFGDLAGLLRLDGLARRSRVPERHRGAIPEDIRRRPTAARRSVPAAADTASRIPDAENASAAIAICTDPATTPSNSMSCVNSGVSASGRVPAFATMRSSTVTIVTDSISGNSLMRVARTPRRMRSSVNNGSMDSAANCAAAALPNCATRALRASSTERYHDTPSSSAVSNDAHNASNVACQRRLVRASRTFGHIGLTGMVWGR